MKDKLQLLVCCHKFDKNIRRNSPYIPIQVGKELHPDLDLGFVNDNKGENISGKNTGWNELTAIYWGWKNIKEVDYLGICHYRRYFDVNWDELDVEEYMRDYDIVTVQNYIGYEMNMNKTGLISSTTQEDFYIYLDTLITIHPEYKQKIIDYFYNYNKFVPFNMFVASKKIYDEYCEFVFPVLFEVEKRIKPHFYSRLKRVIGYMGEWTLGVFILCHDLKVKEVPYIMCGDVNYMKPTTYSFFELIKWRLKMYRKLQSPKVREVIVPEDVRNALRNDGVNLNTI